LSFPSISLSPSAIYALSLHDALPICDILCQCATHITRGVTDSLQSGADTLKGISHFGKFALFNIQITQSVFGIVQGMPQTIQLIDLLIVFCTELLTYCCILLTSGHQLIVATFLIVDILLLVIIRLA